MALRDILDRQANSIEYVLHTHGIQAYVDGGRLSSRLAHFHVSLPPGVRPRQLSTLVPELAGVLGVNSCRLYSGEDGVYLEVPRPDPVPVRLLSLVQRVADVVPPVTATLGLDGEGTPLLLRLNASDVDPVLVAGDEGAGKSGLLRSMALSLSLHNSPDGVRLLLLDCTGEGSAFRGMEGLPHLACPVAHGRVDSMVSLRWPLRALARRANMSASDELTFDDEDQDDEPLFEYNESRSDEPALVILINGADVLCSGGNRRADAEGTNALNKLLADGSRHGIHVVISAEQPERLAEIEARWGARIAGRLSSPEAAREALGVKGSGAQGLLGGGDFIIALNAELIRFQAGGVSESELGKAVNLIQSCSQAQAEVEQEEPLMPPRAPRKPQRELEEPVQLRRLWSGD
ncbi:MAG TPA: FtsK/SpoIIIE domain-containing protein [Chloroflexia bacterium]|nr:FtsK/SpoIIIE domain-containing protein [Chloroflexia bacterium]